MNLGRAVYSPQVAAAVRRAGVFFVDIPRTSSSSIRTELALKFGYPFGKANVTSSATGRMQGYPDHLTAAEAIQMVGGDVWSELYSFSIVRNPWDRHISLYRWRTSSFVQKPLDLTFDAYLAELRQHFRGIQSNYFLFPPHYLSCSNFVFGADDVCLVKEVVHFETRDKDLPRIGQRLGLNVGNIRIQDVANTSERPIAYTAGQIDLMAELYADDVKHFGYAPDLSRCAR